MFDVYTKFFNYLYTQHLSIEKELGGQARGFVRLLSQQPTPDLSANDLASQYEKYLRSLIRFAMKSPLEIYFYEFFEGAGMLRKTSRGTSIYLNPKPTRIRLSESDVNEIHLSLQASSALANVLLPRTASSDDHAPQQQGRSWGQRAKPPMPPPPPAAMAEPEPEAEASSSREFLVTGHDPQGIAVTTFELQQLYVLRFRVGALVPENLATGELAVADVVEGGLRTHWVVTSTGVEIGTRRGDTWYAEFDLTIPEKGESEAVDLGIRITGSDPSMLITVYALGSGNQREVYRELAVDLKSGPRVESDDVCAAPRHLNLRTTHEWTTPLSHVLVVVMRGLAKTNTVRGSADYNLTELWPATDNLIGGPVQSVRSSLERFRAKWDSYLNDLDPADIASRLAEGGWKPYTGSQGWTPLPDGADPKHRASFAQIASSQELRDLASDGYSLFDSCFPTGSDLRDMIEHLAPGCRIDFDWTEKSGAGWVSHVPWGLMYLEAPDPTGAQPVDCEKFLGLRFRIGSRSWPTASPSRALGDPSSVHALNLLYWGDQPEDEVAIESQWQDKTYGAWPLQHVVPTPSQPDAKKQVVLALDSPAPNPVGVLYLYCHCNVMDGSQVVLRFGNTSQPQDTLQRGDLSQKKLVDAPLVFANACNTGSSDPHLTNELEARFFRRGVRAFIGTETKVPVQLASRIAWLFFQFFYRRIDGDPMSAGEALTQARMVLWTQYRNIGGLFYSVVNQYDLYFASSQEVERLRV